MYTLPEEDLFQRLEEGPEPQDQIVDKLVTNLAAMDTAVFNDYLTVTKHQHAQSRKVTFKEVAKSTFEVIISYGIGGIATLGYIGAAKKAAKGNLFNYYMNPIGAVVLNFLVNGYFFDLVISPPIDSLIMQKPSDVKAALMRLKKLDPSCTSKLWRAGKGFILFLLILGPSILSAYPFYQLDKTESEHSEFISEIVLLSATALQYNGVEALFYQLIPFLFSPFKAIYRRLNAEAMRNYKIQTTISLLKNSHKEAWGSIHQEVLKLIQTKQEDKLQDIYALVKKSNPSKEESILLLKKLLEIAQKDEYQSSPIGKVIVQIIMLVLTTASLPGYFLKTKEGAADYAQLHDAALEWLLGSAIFLVSVALSFAVGWSAGGDLYDIFAYAFNGMKDTWNKSAGFTDFFKRGWQNKFNPESWYSLFRMPLPIQQNPRILLSLILTLDILGYWSTSTSVYLNEETLGSYIAEYLRLATIVSVVIFNDFPVDKVLGSAQRFFSRIFGTEKTKEEIKLEQYISNQKNLSTEMDDFQFLEIANEIVESLNMDSTEKESTLKLLFGNKTPVDIFGEDHKYSKRKFIEIIPRLKNKRIHELSLVGFFSRRGQEEDPLLANIQGYGSTKLSTLSI